MIGQGHAGSFGGGIRIPLENRAVLKKLGRQDPLQDNRAVWMEKSGSFEKKLGQPGSLDRSRAALKKMGSWGCATGQLGSFDGKSGQFEKKVGQVGIWQRTSGKSGNFPKSLGRGYVKTGRQLPGIG